jgi:hypothetical protein
MFFCYFNVAKWPIVAGCLVSPTNPNNVSRYKRSSISTKPTLNEYSHGSALRDHFQAENAHGRFKQFAFAGS